MRNGRRGLLRIAILPSKSIMKDFRVNSEAEKHSSTSRNVSTIRQIMFNYHKYPSPSQHGELVFLSSYFHMSSLPMLCLKLNIFSLDCHVFLMTWPNYNQFEGKHKFSESLQQCSANGKLSLKDFCYLTVTLLWISNGSSYSGTHLNIFHSKHTFHPKHQLHHLIS